MRLGLLLTLLLSFNISFSQSNITAYLDNLNSAKNDSEKIVTYRTIFNHYQYTNPDSATYFLNQGLSYFTKRQYKYGMARIMMLLAYIDVNEGRMETGKLRENAALQIFLELNKPADIANVYNSLGVIEGKNSNFDAATKLFLKALKVYDSLKDIKGLRTTYMKLGVVNERYNNLDKALAYYTKALEIGRNIHDLKNDLNLYNDVGIIYGKKGDNATAVKWFDSALKKCDDPEFIGIKTLTLMNYGIVLDHMNDEDKALKYLNEALILAQSSGQLEDYVRINLNIASILGKNNPRQALISLLEGLKTARQIGQKSLQIEILDAIIEINKKLHDYKNALVAMEERKDMQDSVYGLQKARAVANLQSLYELNKSNERVRELELAERKNTEQKNVIIIVALILSASLLTLVFQYRKLRMLNRQLFKREAELEKSNTEKDKLFSIIGHDLRGPIANIPQILEISTEESITPEEKTFLLESLKEHSIASLDTLDKLLYWGQMQIKGLGINKVPIRAYDNIQGVLKLVRNAAEQKHIVILNKVNKDIRAIADPAHFDFIIRNLIGNAIKFTNENGAIELNADDHTHKGEIVFSIKENGIGMSKEQQAHIFDAFSNSTLGTANERGTSLGLMLCKEFILENGGNIWVESEEGKGSTFYFSLKTSL